MAVADVAALLGVLLVAVGAGVIFVPAGLIVAGVLLLWSAVALERGRGNPSS